jgi:hypothetical protein
MIYFGVFGHSFELFSHLSPWQLSIAGKAKEKVKSVSEMNM